MFAVLLLTVLALILLVKNSLAVEAWYQPPGENVRGDLASNPVWLNGSLQTLSFATDMEQWQMWIVQFSMPGNTTGVAARTIVVHHPTTRTF